MLDEKRTKEIVRGQSLEHEKEYKKVKRKLAKKVLIESGGGEKRRES